MSADDSSLPVVPLTGGRDVASVDPSALIAVLRSVLARLRDMTSTSGDIDGHIGADNALETLSEFRDYIHSHESDDSGPFLSIVLLIEGASHAHVRDALVALDAQSSRDFELIVIPGTHVDLVAVEELLAPFSWDLATRTRVVEESSWASARNAGVSEGLAIAQGRWITFVDATSVVFGHFVATFADLVAASTAAVVRARALRQPLRELTWPDGRRGYEPVGGALPASAPCFSLVAHLEDLGHSDPTYLRGSPPGSYALRRREADLLGLYDDENQLLLEAAILGGVHDAPDDVVVLLHYFE